MSCVVGKVTVGLAMRHAHGLQWFIAVDSRDQDLYKMNIPPTQYKRATIHLSIHHQVKFPAMIPDVTATVSQLVSTTSYDI